MDRAEFLRAAPASGEAARLRWTALPVYRETGTSRESRGDGGGWLGLRSPVRVLAGGVPDGSAARVCCAALLVCRVRVAFTEKRRRGRRWAGPVPNGSGARRWRWSAGAATAATGPGPRTSVPVLVGGAPDGGDDDAGGAGGAGLRWSAAVLRPGRGHELHVGAAASASVSSRGVALAPQFRDTEQHGVFCPPMPEFPVGPRPCCGGGGARGAPDGAKTAPGVDFSCASWPRRPPGSPVKRASARKSPPHRAVELPSAAPGRHERRVVAPRAPDPAHPRAARVPATAPRGAASGRCGPDRNTATLSRPTAAGVSGMPVHPAMIVNLWPRNALSCDHKFTIDASSLSPGWDSAPNPSLQTDSMAPLSTNAGFRPDSGRNPVETAHWMRRPTLRRPPNAAPAARATGKHPTRQPQAQPTTALASAFP
ncbi:hypothetical protein EKD16_07735 [Streptomonospora litoralis]|uniref:Uncharacterized protein n=1 Tax=Streptomonospora litoralis TaxID=2498135 RepID=A0A4P6PYY6_9ACTN|nr:hypothetical protein EKD16_07735 [Streptomonospora litoralis]